MLTKVELLQKFIANLATSIQSTEWLLRDLQFRKQELEKLLLEEVDNPTEKVVKLDDKGWEVPQGKPHYKDN